MNKYIILLVRTLLILSSLIMVMLASCVKDKPNPVINNNTKHTKGVLVLNEGAYGNNNAEISLIEYGTNKITNKLFEQANSTSLGDVAQSITRVRDKYIICVNNSSKLVVIDTSTFKVVKIISDIQFPRYIIQTDTTTFYVSSLYSNKVYVLDAGTYAVKKIILVDYNNTEHMLQTNNILWVCNWDTACRHLYKVNVQTHNIVERVNIFHAAPHSIVKDKEGMIWILSGNKYKNKASYLTRINPVNNNILQQLAFSNNEDPVRLHTNASGDTLYYININYSGNTHNGLYKLGIHESKLPNEPFIHAPANTYFWNMGIDANTGDIWLSDPKGFTQNSTVYKYSVQGFMLNSFQTGIGSNQFLFQ